MKKAPIVMILGTNRDESNSFIISQIIARLYEDLGESLEFIDLKDLPQEMYSPEAYSKKPEALNPFIDLVVKSRGLIFIVPEYNGSMPGALKYFIDMLKFPESFEHKPVAFVGLSSGIWGALRAVEHLQGVFGYRNGFVYPNRVFLPRINDLLKDLNHFKETLEYKLLIEQTRGFSVFCDCIVDMKERLKKYA